MADLVITIKGGAKTEADLKKIADAYRAIGKEAENAGKKTKGAQGTGLISKEEAQVTRRFGAGVGGQLGGGVARLTNLATLGGGLALAGVGLMAAVKGIQAISAADERAAETATENIRVMREFGKVTQEVATKMQESAAARFGKMDVYDRAAAIAKGGPGAAAIKFAEEADKERERIAKGRFANDLMAAKSAELSQARAPNLIASQPGLEAMRAKIEEQRAKVETQSGLGRFFENAGTRLSFGASEREEDKLARMEEAFAKASESIISAAVALDRSTNARATGAPTP